MKQQVFIAAILMVSMACSSKKESDTDETDSSSLNPPAVVTDALIRDFSDATNVTWDKEDGSYEANFKQNEQTLSALYSDDGNLLETERDINSSGLPETAIEYVTQNYPATKITEAAIITKSNTDTVYEAEVNGKDLLFDSEGNFIKETSEKQRLFSTGWI